VERGARPAKQSYLSKREMPTSEVNPRTMSASLLPSRTLWSTQVDIRRLRRKRVAGTLLPDVLPYDPTRPASFPDNGRTLTDDAFRFFYSHPHKWKITGDNVGPHGDLLLEFPYVGPPHQSRVTKAPHRATRNQNQT